MCERLKQTVLKTVIPERVSGVRIPLPPPDSLQLREMFCFLYRPNRQSPFAAGYRLYNRSTGECGWRKVPRFKGPHRDLGLGSFLLDLWLLWKWPTIEIILTRAFRGAHLVKFPTSRLLAQNNFRLTRHPTRIRTLVVSAIA